MTDKQDVFRETKQALLQCVGLCMLPLTPSFTAGDICRFAVTHLHWPSNESELSYGGKPWADILHAWPMLSPVVQKVWKRVRQSLLPFVKAVCCLLVQIIRLTVQPAVH